MLRRLQQIVFGDAVDHVVVTRQIIQPQIEAFHAVDVRRDAFIALETQRHAASKITLIVGEILVADCLCRQALDFFHDGGGRQRHIVGVDAGADGPGIRSVAAAQATVSIISQALFFAHALADSPHHAEFAQNAIGQLSRQIIFRLARRTDDAHADIRLGLAGHGDRRTHTVGGILRLMRLPRRRLIRIAPIAKGIRRQLQGLRLLHRADDHEDHAARTEMPGMEILQVAKANVGNAVFVAIGPVMIGMRIGIERFPHRLRRAITGVEAAVLQPGQAFAAQALDVLAGEDRVAQRIAGGI